MISSASLHVGLADTGDDEDDTAIAATARSAVHDVLEPTMMRWFKFKGLGVDERESDKPLVSLGYSYKRPGPLPSCLLSSKDEDSQQSGCKLPID